MMIEVNLLPGELRRVEHTPLPRFLVIIIGTAAIMATTAFGIVVNWRRVPDLKARELGLLNDIGRSKVQASVYDRLLDQIAETKDRKTAIGELWRKRIPWSEKLWQMAVMTPNFLGFREAKLEEPRGGGVRKEGDTGGLLKVECISGTTDHARVGNVRRIFEGGYRVAYDPDPWIGKRFFEAFTDVLPTGTKKVEKPEYEEKEALEFSLQMPLKTASTRLDEAVKRVTDGMSRKRAAERVKAVAEKRAVRQPAGTGPKETVTRPEVKETADDEAEAPTGETPATSAETGTSSTQGRPATEETPAAGEGAATETVPAPAPKETGADGDAPAEDAPEHDGTDATEAPAKDEAPAVADEEPVATPSVRETREAPETPAEDAPAGDDAKDAEKPTPATKTEASKAVKGGRTDGENTENQED